jgi:hypothetical protein
MPHILGARKDPYMRILTFYFPNNMIDLVRVVDSNDQNFGLFNAGSLQQLMPVRIPVIYLYPKPPEEPDIVGVIIQNGCAYTIGSEESSYHHPESTVTGDDDITVFIRDIVGLFLRFRPAEHRLNNTFV